VTRAAARRNLLVLLLEDGSEAQLRQAVEDRADESLSVHVVAPAQVGPLAWLASDEDDARRQAEVRALAAEWTLADRAEAGGEAGDVDPVQAVEDALRRFPADEILVVGGASANGALDASLKRFGVPVTRAGGSLPPAGHTRLRETTRAIVAGRSRATPFVFFLGVNVALLALAAVLTAIVVLVLWLR
jgi:hypothetical protein